MLIIYVLFQKQFMKHFVENAQGRTKPEFLKEKLDNFYEKRMGKEWEGRHILRGVSMKSDDINLSSNDYLQLSTHQNVIDAQIDILKEQFSTPLMSASFIHGNAPQSRLERELAVFFKSESAILCQSGYVANLGLIQTLIEGTDCPVYIDMMAHMSLWNGIQLGDGKAVSFLHNDLDHLEKKIEQFGPGLIVVDSVYSTDGSIAPLKELSVLAKLNGCQLIVDESHSFGVCGVDGRGMVCELGIENDVLFRTASLAKAFASRAGLILGKSDFNDFFSVTAKPQIFSSALMPSDIASIDAVLKLVRSGHGESQRKALNENVRLLRELFLSNGIDVSESQSQIMAIKMDSEKKLLILKEELEEQGIFAAPFCSPATARKRPVLRLSLHAGLSEKQLKFVNDKCKSFFSK